MAFSFFWLSIVFVLLVSIFDTNGESKFCVDTVSYDPFDSVEHDRRDNKNELKIMQFNADWITMEGEDNWDKKSTLTKKPIHGFNTPEAAKDHLAKVANIIAVENPDIVVMQEVAGCKALKNVQANLGDIKDKYKPYVIKNYDSLNQHVGILTKLDPVEIEINREKSKLKVSYFKFYVEQLQTEENEPYFIDLYGIHLASHQSILDRDDQAKELKNWIKHGNNNLKKYVIVIGDYNDYDYYTVPQKFIKVGKDIENINQNQHIVMTDQSGSELTRSDALRMIRESRAFEYGSFINAMYFAKKSDRKTNDAREPRAIDHIMMTEQLAKFLTKVKFNTDIIGEEDSSPEEHGYIIVALDLTRSKDVDLHMRKIVYDFDQKILKSMTLADIDENLVEGMKRIENKIKIDKEKMTKIETEKTAAQAKYELTQTIEKSLKLLLDAKDSIIKPLEDHETKLDELQKILKILTDGFKNFNKNLDEDDKEFFKDKARIYGVYIGYSTIKVGTKKKGKKTKTVPSDFPASDYVNKVIKVCKTKIKEQEGFISKIENGDELKKNEEDIKEANRDWVETKKLMDEHHANKKKLLEEFMVRDEKKIKSSIKANEKILTKLKSYHTVSKEKDSVSKATSNDREYGFNLDFGDTDSGVFNGNTYMDTFIINQTLLLLIVGTVVCFCGIFGSGFCIGYLGSWSLEKYNKISENNKFVTI